MAPAPETEIGRDLRRYVDAVLAEGEGVRLPGEPSSAPARRPARHRLVAAAAAVALALGGAAVVTADLGSDSGGEVATEGPVATEPPRSATAGVPTDLTWVEAGTAPVAVGIEDMGAVVVGPRVVIVVSNRLGPGVQVVTTALDGSDAQEGALAPLDPRAQPGIVSTGTEVVVAGGSTGTAGLETFGAAYDPATDTWRTIAAPPEGTGVGAQTDGVWTGSEIVWWSEGVAYDPANDAWRTIAATPLSDREEAGVAAVGGKVVVWGGCEGECSAADDPTLPGDGAVYDPGTDTWTALASSPLSGGLAPLAVADADGVTFVAGDGEGAAAAARIDLATGAWTALPDPPIGPQRYVRGQLLGDGEDVLVGGGPGTETEGDGALAVYDPSDEVWSEPFASPGEAPLHGVVAAGDGLVGVDVDGRVWSGSFDR